MMELEELENEKRKKIRFGRFESPWCDPVFDPSRPILWEPLSYHKVIKDPWNSFHCIYTA